VETPTDSRVALVTGASRGIGRAIAERLAADGDRVVLTARSEERLEELAAQIRAAGGDAYARPCDVGDNATFEALVKSTAKEFGRLDVLVNNAGITRDGLIMRMRDEDWDQVMNVNLRSVFVACRAAARIMLKARSGRIINISSVVGLIGNPGQANYAASKAGLIGLTKALAREFGSRSVTVNAVAPGYITTDMTADLPEAARAALLDKVALKRLGSSADIAAAVSFLASSEAGYITGEVLKVDGGLAM
jgi:3-oxoacyl-[acyl-carrier protein] reductase